MFQLRPTSDVGRLGELITVRASEALSPETLATYLNLPPVRQQVQRLVRGQSAHLYSRDLASLPVPLVPQEVQEEVGERLRCAFAHRTRAAELAAEALSRVEQLVLKADGPLRTAGGLGLAGNRRD